MRASLIGLAVAGLLAPLAQAHAADNCRSLDWRSAPQPSARAMTALDLVRLRDIGPKGFDDPPAHVMAISPDGRWVAFQLRQADPDTNQYCLAMVVQPLDGRGTARFVDTGGEFILAPDGVPTTPATAIGIAAVITPRWSPNGRWFAFLKRTDGIDRVWRVDMATGRSAPVTPEGLDIEDFRIIDARHIIVQVVSVPTSPEAESRTGFHYDDRFVPIRSSVPILSKSTARYAAVDVATGAEQEVAHAEVGLFDPEPSMGVTSSGLSCALSRSAKGRGALASTQIEMACGGVSPVICKQKRCENSYGPIWIAGRNVRFLRHEGWARMTTAIDEWSPKTGRIQRLYTTNAMLADCQPRGSDELICLQETSLRPRRLVAVDLPRGRVREIMDPNPEFGRLALGGVERIKLTSNLGIPAFADVVFPTDYRPGKRYPLIVVQYQSRGFLRGGTGDEFPIQLFANNGFVVLSVQRPFPAGSRGTPTTAIGIDRRNLIGFADRRNVLSVIAQGVNLLVDRGVADPTKVGITGLSDGSSTVQFAALNSSLFSAGIASGCCWEAGQEAWLGPAFAPRLKAIGWPEMIDSARPFWKRISLVQNAKHVRFPLLFEAADDEFRVAIESVTALREAGKPADLFVFPGEFHIKWQPAHRLAVYERSLDWFMFWLRGKTPDSARRRAEVHRWEAMREAGF